MLNCRLKTDRLTDTYTVKKILAYTGGLLGVMLLCATLFSQQLIIDRQVLIHMNDAAGRIREKIVRDMPQASQPEQQEHIIPEEQTVVYNLEIPRFTEHRAELYIEHLAYTVSYHPAWHIPNWVAYCLETHELDGKQARTDKFLPDPMAGDDPVVTQDYAKCGYDRGHMAPTADMKWSGQAMTESFYMTNICPQNHNNNAGDWNDLEELVRGVVRQYGRVYVCCGPVVSDTTQTIGTKRKIIVPQAFFKVLLRQLTDGTWTAIAFVMPNAPGNRPLMTYMVPVREVEQSTGIDFFPTLPDSIENAIEQTYTPAHWTLDR